MTGIPHALKLREVIAPPTRFEISKRRETESIFKLCMEEGLIGQIIGNTQKDLALY
mgnify:CR=1 FL=1